MLFCEKVRIKEDENTIECVKYRLIRKKFEINTKLIYYHFSSLEIVCEKKEEKNLTKYRESFAVAPGHISKSNTMRKRNVIFYV